MIVLCGCKIASMGETALGSWSNCIRNWAKQLRGETTSYSGRIDHDRIISGAKRPQRAVMFFSFTYLKYSSRSHQMHFPYCSSLYKYNYQCDLNDSRNKPINVFATFHRWILPCAPFHKNHFAAVCNLSCFHL